MATTYTVQSSVAVGCSRHPTPRPGRDRTATEHAHEPSTD